MNKQAYEKVLAKCWANPAFKQQLLADPAGTLKAEGVELPEGLKVRAVEDSAGQFTFVIPARPAELSDEMLDGVVGGALNLSFVEPKVEGPKTIAPKGALLGESEYAFHQRYLGT